MNEYVLPAQNSPLILLGRLPYIHSANKDKNTKPVWTMSFLRGFSLLPPNLGKSLAQIERENGVRADYKHDFGEASNFDCGRRTFDVFTFKTITYFS